MSASHRLSGSKPTADEAPQRYSRAAFLARLTAAGTAVAASCVLGAEPAASPANSSQWKGRKQSKVKRWDIVTVGNLSRNRYWGESEARPLRTTVCTCTLVQGDGFRLLVDPSLPSAEQMAAELDRRTGLKVRNVDAVFITHEHGDHWFGLAHFEQAKWLAAPDVAAALNKTGKLAKTVEAVTGQLFDAIEVIPTPGHTLSHHSLRFDCDGLSVVIAGDAVMTQDFWRDRRGYFNCADFDLSAKSMNRLCSLADVIVPGHDNFLLNRDVPAIG